jgi:predicted RecA/RadA family phage recombinase
MAVQDYIAHENGDQLFRKLTAPASGGVVGDAGLVGDRPCVLLTDQDSAGYATVKFNGSFRLPVKGEDGSGNSAIAVNGGVYYDSAATVKINKDATNGVRYGTAVEAVGSGETKTIVVDLH